MTTADRSKTQAGTSVPARLESALERWLARGAVFGGLLLALTAIVAALRLPQALAAPTAGPDYGHYLISANWYAGVDRSGEGPFDPPLVPVLVLLLAPAFGRVEALQLLGPVSAAVMLPAAAFLLARFVPRWAAVLAATVFVLWQQFTEFITFGGVTNLFGIAFALLFFRVFYDALDDPSAGWRPRRTELVAVALALLTLSTHHLTAFVTGATALLWIGLRLVADRGHRREVAWTSLRVGGLSTLAGLVYAPYLYGLVATDAAGGFGQPFPAAGLASLLALVWKFTPALWAIFAMLGVLALARSTRASRLLPFAVALLVTPLVLVATVLASHPVRGLYYEEFPIVFTAALWAMPADRDGTLRPLPPRTVPAAHYGIMAFLAVTVAFLVASVPAVEAAGIETYHSFATDGTLAAFDWVARNTPPDATIALDGGLAPQYNDLWHGMALGWWLEGYANRKVLYQANPVLLPFASKWPEAQDANRIFAGDTVFEDGYLRVADSFPYDDAALPMVGIAYLKDYHPVIGLAVPAVANASTGADYSLVLGGDPNAYVGIASGIGTVRGNYTGPAVQGTRSMAYTSSTHTVETILALRFAPSSPWDAVRLTVRPSPLALVDLTSLGTGEIPFRIDYGPPYPDETGLVRFSWSNLSAPHRTAAAVTPGDVGVGLEWNRTSDQILLRATITVTEETGSGPGAHPLELFTASSILAARHVDFLFLATADLANVQRFEREAGHYRLVFSNAAAFVFAVSPA